jgi:hypothetical protein
MIPRPLMNEGTSHGCRLPALLAVLLACSRLTPTYPALFPALSR